ncbi:MAG TPA: hypothetical protein DEV81_04480 [Cyanobacteria bacterium UBA11049]|nr:hypothetical protein [Cyanobacteria bacterium UBA11049]
MTEPEALKRAGVAGVVGGAGGEYHPPSPLPSSL